MQTLTHIRTRTHTHTHDEAHRTTTSVFHAMKERE